MFLSTAVVYVINKDGIKLPERAFIDSGAQMDMISERLVQQLRLPRSAVQVPISGVGSTVADVRAKVTTKIKSVHSHFESVLDFLVLPKLTERLPSVTVSTRDWNIPNNIKLADPQFNVAINSHLGLIVSGTFNSGQIESPVICASTCCEEGTALAEIMKAFFRIEKLNGESKWSVEELECEEHFKNTTTRDASGRYVVRLPCKESPQQLRRFKTLERRHERRYVEFMNEYIFDPLGMIDTAKAKAKQFMQTLWKLKLENGRAFN
uniref:DUF1758 domain-containing protein n=1 Tax=Anopheles minimus TaxID=112268 RepID=A0A182W2J0_9DIPT